MTDNKNAALDRLLQDARLNATPPEGTCPDAEQLAALASGTLRTAERDVCEAHVADCARCLQLLATLARTDEAPVPSIAWWRPANWTWWLVPVTAAATAVALWVNVAPDREQQTAEREFASAAADQRAPDAPTAPAAPAPAAAAESPQKAAERTASREAPKATAKRITPELRARDLEAARKDEDPRREARGNRAAVDARAVLPRAPMESQPKATAPAAAAPSPPPAAAAKPLASPVEAVPLPQPVAQSAARRGAAQDRLAASFRDAAGAPLEIVSSDPAIKWRVSGARIERTSDGGSTWNVQFTAAAQLLAGSSASPMVAWIVGRGGTVLLTTDGQRWQRTPFPEAVDLLSVRARSDREADVTADGGRVFRTFDGGKTWLLQESPPAPF